ncbi:Recombination protein RecR [Nitrospina gracilis 3/211]|uniref:Recombination protein RecR n=1 Tax=Nitrospina gracilis (strain 3/211) TaxID=1266370 RepID=M1YWB4_NITG3|nr:MULTISPECIES: recombination mediator RecR [Nitrospina]MCF8722976.1 recombination protein RecR [Nitrospina sp. Nb-3]CCQ89946.1 Recombination protein RecR [Nitrospina gracilis 3/211]
MKRPAPVTELIEELKRLPGIGQKTAERLSFYLMRGPKEQAEKLSRAVVNIKEKIVLCKNCHGISDKELCDICSDTRRDHGVICVVEEPYDVYVMENIGDFKGEYHVLMGVISPLDGIGPADLTIGELKAKTETREIKEIILATNPDMEGESTAVFIARMMKGCNVRVTRIARGLPVGGDIEYADPVTLSKSLEGRTEMKFSD